jgi:F-type H+-transporting ATPase subunit b
MFLTPDGTFWIQLVNFVVFFAILSVVFLRPVSAAIRKRRLYINSVTEDYDRYQAESKALRAQADAARAAARREAEQILAKARAESSDEVAELATQYSQRAAQAVKDAHDTVDGEMRAAREGEAQVARKLADLVVQRTLSEAAK